MGAPSHGTSGSSAPPPLPTPSSTIVFKGDSITAGINLNTASYPAQFAANTGYNAVDKGISGETLATANTNYATEIAPLYNAATENTLVLLEGINDISFGSTDTALKSTLQTYCGKAKATGFKIIVGTLLPTSYLSWTGTMETYRANYNTWLRANWASFADGLVDFAAIAQFATPAAPYYQSDLLHPTNVAARLMAELLRTRFGLANVNDTTPGAFTFTDITGAATSTDYTSNTIELAGFTAPAAISISGGAYSLNGGAFTTASGTVNPYDKVQVKLTSSASTGVAVNATLTVGGVSDTYTVTTAVPYVGPGDIAGGAFGWWGFRAYNAAYIGGPAMDVWRASDGTTRTINTIAGGGLDMATLTTFLSATTGKVVKLYDQTGNGNHLSQATGSQQPTLTLNAIGSLPAATFSAASNQGLTGPSTITQAQPLSGSLVAKHYGTSALAIAASDNLAHASFIMSATAGNWQLFSNSQSANVAAADNAFHAAQAVWNNTSSSLMIDGTTTSGLSVGTSGFSDKPEIGGGTFPVNMVFMETGYWAGAISGANQSSLNSNQRAWYGF